MKNLITGGASKGHRVKSGKSALVYVGVVILGIAVVIAAGYLFFGDMIKEQLFPKPRPVIRVVPNPEPLVPLAEQETHEEVLNLEETTETEKVEDSNEPAETPEKLKPVESPKPKVQTKVPVKIAPKPPVPTHVVIKQPKQSVKKTKPLAVVVAKPKDLSANAESADTSRATFSAYVALAKAEMASGNEKNAQAYYMKAYDIVPNEDIAYNIALIHLYRNQPDVAVTWMDSSSITEEGASKIVLQMINNGNRSSAKSAIDNKINGDINGNIYYTSGYLKELEGDINGAANHYREAMLRSGYSEYSTFAYARMLDKQGNTAEARTYYAYVANGHNMELKLSATQRLEGITISEIEK